MNREADTDPPARYDTTAVALAIGDRLYSHLSATRGSTFAARRAGR